MIPLPILLAMGSALLGTSVVTGAAEGVIDGIVVNGTRGYQPVSEAEVVLRVFTQGQFASVARTTTGHDGRFHFDNLPTDSVGPYLPGASRGDVHFPGPRVQLTPREPCTEVRLVVFDSVSEPNPLVIERQDVIVQPEPGTLTVTESIWIDNPSSQCYVGRSLHAGGNPVTLRLTIPGDFKRITFDKEAFGRRFALIDGQLVTSIPWPPGKRELRFKYVIANDTKRRIWQREVDLPCLHLRLTVPTTDSDSVSCNLPRLSAVKTETVHFESDGALLPGHVIQLQLGHLPLPLMVYARRAALVVLTLLCAVVSVVSIRRRHSANRDGKGVGNGFLPRCWN